MQIGRRKEGSLVDAATALKADADAFNPLRAAKFFSDISQSIGVKKSVAQVYKELEEFDVDAYLNETKPSS